MCTLIRRRMHNARDLRYSRDGASLEILAIRKLLYDAGGNGNRAFLKFSPVLTIATYCGRIFQGCFFADQRWWRGSCQKNPKTGRIDRVCCYTSFSGIDVGMPNTARANDVLQREFSGAAGNPLVLPRGSDKSAQVLVRACQQPARTTSGCPGRVRSRARCTNAFDASIVGTNACDGSSKRSDVNKPRQQRSTLAARQNSCRQAKACGRHQRDNGQICSGKRAGRKYRAVNSGAPGSESKHIAG